MAIVSVVIPCHNYGRFLREAIESVLAQTHAEVELIVVDYESTDDTDRIVAGYPQVKYLRRTDRTLGVARNDGLAESVGEFLWFLDADDRLIPDAVESSVACLGMHPDCAFAYGHVKHFDASGPAPYRGGAPPGCLGEAEPYGWMLRMNNPLRTTGAVLYRRRILEDAGGFATDIALSEDLELNMRLARSHPICCNDRIVLEQRIHGSVGSLSRKWRQGLVDSVAVQRKQRAYVNAHPSYKDDYRKGLRVARSYWGSHLAKETATLLVARSYREAARNLLTLARRYPAGLLEVILQTSRGAVRRLRSA